MFKVTFLAIDCNYIKECFRGQYDYFFLLHHSCPCFYVCLSYIYEFLANRHRPRTRILFNLISYITSWDHFNLDASIRYISFFFSIVISSSHICVRRHLIQVRHLIIMGLVYSLFLFRFFLVWTFPIKRICGIDISQQDTCWSKNSMYMYTYEWFDLIKKYEKARRVILNNDIHNHMYDVTFLTRSKVKRMWTGTRTAGYMLFLSNSLISSMDKECFWAKLAEYVVVVIIIFCIHFLQ